MRGCARIATPHPPWARSRRVTYIAKRPARLASGKAKGRALEPSASQTKGGFVFVLLGRKCKQCTSRSPIPSWYCNHSRVSAGGLSRIGFVCLDLGCPLCVGFVVSLHISSRNKRRPRVGSASRGVFFFFCLRGRGPSSSQCGCTLLAALAGFWSSAFASELAQAQESHALEGFAEFFVIQFLGQHVRRAMCSGTLSSVENPYCP